MLRAEADSTRRDACRSPSPDDSALHGVSRPVDSVESVPVGTFSRSFLPTHPTNQPELLIQINLHQLPSRYWTSSRSITDAATMLSPLALGTLETRTQALQRRGCLDGADGRGAVCAVVVVQRARLVEYEAPSLPCGIVPSPLRTRRARANGRWIKTRTAPRRGEGHWGGRGMHRSPRWSWCDPRSQAGFTRENARIAISVADLRSRQSRTAQSVTDPARTC